MNCINCECSTCVNPKCSCLNKFTKNAEYCSHNFCGCEYYEYDYGEIKRY